MLKDNITCASQNCLICRILFGVFLAFFALSSSADAYSDSLCSSPLVFLNGQNDADDPVITNELNLNAAFNTIHDLKDPDNLSQQHHALSQASVQYGPAYCIKKIQISANNIKFSQICRLLSSDPSPPFI